MDTAGLENAALKGLKVLSLSHVVAGPMAASLLADFGADVVHVEEPKTGDPARRMGYARDGIYVWWKVAGRNKRSVTIDLRKPEGQELTRELAAWADVVISSIRPATLDAWGLGFEALRKVNSRIIMLQITGYGMTGPRKDEPGFGKVGEAMSGVVGLTGLPEMPIHTAFSHGDTVTGLMSAFAILAANHRRLTDKDFKGELIDLALYESLFRLVEWQVIAYDQLGMTTARNGNRLGFAPAAVANVYKSSDDVWVTVTSGTAPSVVRIAALLGLPAEDYATAEKQRENDDVIDEALKQWIGKRTADEALEAMRNAKVVASRIYTIEDIMTDDVFRARDNIATVQDPDLGPIRMQNVVPKMTNHGGNIWRSGAQLGEDNELVWKEWLGMSPERFKALRTAGVI